MSEQLAAGVALDAEIARTIFKIKRLYTWNGEPWTGQEGEWLVYIPSGKPWRTHSIDAVALPRFSEDPGAAMMLLDDWQDYDIQRRNGWYTVELFEPSREHRAHAETLPLAICRARLIAARRAAEER